MMSQLPYARAGIVVPRYSHGAVERNRVKRRLREIVRLDMLRLLRGMDLIVRALPSAYVATYADLREQCRRVCERLGNATS
jgi:ribonuclease P protein component